MRHSDEQYAIAAGLAEELPAVCDTLGLNLRFVVNENDCEVIVFLKGPGTYIAYLDIDATIEIWTVGKGPTGPVGHTEYANPNFLTEIATLLKRRVDHLANRPE